MKHGKRLTLKQKKLLKSMKLDPRSWLLERDTTTEMVFVHRTSDAIKVVRKADL